MSERIPSSLMRSVVMAVKMNSGPDTFTGTRRSLLTRLKHWDDSEGWREFFDTYGKLIYGFAKKAGLGDAESEDVVQETMLAVAKQMPGFRYDPAKGSFRRWLFNQARWRIADQFRKRRRAALVQAVPDDTSTGTGPMERVPDAAEEKLQAAWDAEWRENQLARALECVKTKVSERQFQMFHLFAVQGWSMAEIIRTLKVNRAQVYMAKLRVSRLLKAELAALDSGAT
jgi:RNA polymerase sigma factor (sigma-70 family)